MLSFLSNKSIVLVPCSPMTRALKTHLEDKYNVNVSGFIDRNPDNKQIYPYQDIKKLDFDYVVLLSPNHAQSIHSDLKKNNTPSAKIKEVILSKGKYLPANQGSKSFDPDNPVFKYLYYFLTFAQKLTTYKRTGNVFISRGFISSNNYALFLYACRVKKKTVLLSNNKEQIALLKQAGLPAQYIGFFSCLYAFLLARNIFFDQGDTGYLPVKLKSFRLIQLWHGVGLKKMRKFEDVSYDYFISTSHWTNNSNFKYRFNASHFLNCGYPRNDILLKQNLDKLDCLLTDQNTLDFINKRKTSRFIFYLPTHRESNNNIGLDFDLLNAELVSMDTYLIIKLHPFVLQYYSSVVSKALSNIILFDPEADLYPVMRSCEMLISDYSSVVYDFMLMNKPLVFYVYDYDQYLKNYGEFLFDFADYSPGAIVKNQMELVQEIRKFINKKINLPDNYQKVKDKFFDYTDACSSKRILKELET